MPVVRFRNRQASGRVVSVIDRGLWLPPTATALSTETIDETDPMMTGLSAKTPDQLAGRRTRHRSDPKLPLARWRSTHEDGNPELQGLKVGPRPVQSCKPGVVVVAAGGVPAGAPLTTFSILGAILGKAEWSNKSSRGTNFAK
ncbi:hypothetical protein CPLU01_02801 [Colletotrichum plurivorum]|uniref:Uncharacterized protein n=1 Tax=Colletotrichum plurivorum TaxID=2175906 RepID=A0A8H6KV80_9PEZI|nr:hypothetical protein CPLU01_02801 [Colletotrichum plurivorum]